MQDSSDSNQTFYHAADTLVISVQNPFAGHLLKPVNDRATFPDQLTPDWVSIAIIVIIALFAWYKLFYYRMFSQLINAFFSMATTNQIVRDESVLLQRASLNASVISYLVGGLFLYQASTYYEWSHPFLDVGFTRFITFAFLIAMIYSIKMIGLRFLSNVFNADRPASAYIFTVFLFNMVGGLILLPIVVLLAYAPSHLRYFFIQTGIVLLAVLLLYRLMRAVMIWLSIQRASVFYLFLYLCAFEVAPLLLIRKIVMMQA